MARGAAWWTFPLLLVAATAAPGEAQPLRDLCADRPGLGTPPCILDAGHFQIELGLADWTRDETAGVRTDSWLLGDLLVRYGLDARTELQLGVPLYGHTRIRDKTSRSVLSSSGIGDLTVALRHSLSHPDGSGASVAIQPFVTLPTGGQTLGAGDWSAGVIVPVSVGLGGNVSLGLTPEIDAATDADRHGRHLAYSGIAGLDLGLGRVDITLEAEAMRDEDPSGHSTETLAGLSLAWEASANLQLDAGANLGLSHDAPDTEFYVGIARRF